MVAIFDKEDMDVKCTKDVTEPAVKKPKGLSKV